MIPTSIAARRRTALMAQQQPILDDNRRQQQEGSTDFQWVPDIRRTGTVSGTTARAGGIRPPSHRIPARAPVIGSADDRRHVGAPESVQGGPWMHEAQGAPAAVAQQA